ncbi:hypothetical protein TRFO_39033 [Tritrichomonas foetus]|uniref:Uncharacterized protein n=1 Tax=Tritrichomonas foetus TaxID=1144522 RepID=A0A1J4J7Z9_9EUKA|nr:hypothetical protein TRFO_39033 [Tritrichomonas foetus]|eukprot:OHS94793.1 hypothetical protein TRFO_39033 [Tritrichomonas foetus]
MNSIEISSDGSYSPNLDDNNNSAHFITGSPVRSKSPISPISSSFSNSQPILTLVDEAASQLRAVTLPNDKEQLQFLETLKKTNQPMKKISILVDFLIEKVTSSSLEVTKMYKEMQTAREESKISESKASRLLLHLQQNIKLITRVATNNGETTLAQEAALNVQSVSQLDAQIPPDYIRQLKQTLSNKKDPMVQVEIMELLKQEIAINSLFRKQTQQLTKTSENLVKSISEIKNQMSTMSLKQTEKLKQQIKKYHTFIKQICDSCGCDEAHIIETIQKSTDQAKRNQASIDLLSKKLQQMKGESETKISQLVNEKSNLTNEINILKHQIGQYENVQKNAQRVRMKLCELLGVQANIKSSEFESLVFAANSAIPVVNNYLSLQKTLGVEPMKANEYIQDLRDEIARLKNDQEKKRILMEKQAATIAELQDKSWKNWGMEPVGSTQNINFSNTQSIDENSASYEQSPPTTKSTSLADSNYTTFNYDDTADEDQLGQLTEIQNQFSSIEKELDAIRNQVNNS